MQSSPSFSWVALLSCVSPSKYLCFVFLLYFPSVLSTHQYNEIHSAISPSLPLVVLRYFLSVLPATIIPSQLLFYLPNTHTLVPLRCPFSVFHFTHYLLLSSCHPSIYKTVVLLSFQCFQSFRFV